MVVSRTGIRGSITEEQCETAQPFAWLLSEDQGVWRIMDGLWRLPGAALAVFWLVTDVEAYNCYVSQQQASSGSKRYHWVLQGAASLDPCGCTAFLLGGVNTSPADAGSVRYFNVPDLRKTLEEIRRTLGCQDDEQTFVTGPEGDILFPFGSFTTPLHTTFELQMSHPPDSLPAYARLYLATCAPLTSSCPAPYMIGISKKFTVDEMIMYMYKLMSGVAPPEYVSKGREIIPTGLSRQFTVTYEHSTDMNGNISGVKIEVTFGTQGEYPSVLYTANTNEEEVQRVGIFSTVEAEWKFLNP